jgi:hypothetical protein
MVLAERKLGNRCVYVEPVHGLFIRGLNSGPAEDVDPRVPLYEP